MGYFLQMPSVKCDFDVNQIFNFKYKLELDQHAMSFPNCKNYCLYQILAKNIFRIVNEYNCIFKILATQITKANNFFFAKI